MSQPVVSGAQPRKRLLRLVSFGLALALLALVLFRMNLRRWIRESFMQRVTSSHYEVAFPVGAVPPKVMQDFAQQREQLFTALDRKLNDAVSNGQITVVFDSPAAASSGTLLYSVEGMTVRTTLNTAANPPVPELSPVADAEAMLSAAWGKPGSPQIAYWTALWLVGQWQGQDLGMAAAMAEQRLGYKNVASVLSQTSGGLAPQDRAVFGAAWLSEVSELGGAAQVRKLYSARLSNLDIAAATTALGTPAPELERKWQMWIYANVAGMPAGSHQMIIPSLPTQ